MHSKRIVMVLMGLLASLGMLSGVSQKSYAQAAQNGGQPAIARHIGVIKSIDGSMLTLTPESGPEIKALVQSNARIVRLAPGDKDVKNATPIQLQDIHVGDTVRVRGYASANDTINTLEVLVISQAVVAAVGDQMRQDWQKRGLGGLVSGVDSGAGTVTISVTGFGGTKSVAVHSTKDTVFRRYAPESIKFEDAKASSLEQILVGDQLRARGTRSADGTEFAAEEIVTGHFRNVAGLVTSADASSNTISVQDLLSKKTVEIKVTADSQLRKLPPEMAQRIAMRLKGAMPPGMPGGSGGNAAGPGGSSYGSSAEAQRPPSGGPGGMGGGMRGGAPDFQQMLSRMPAVTLADLHKGDAVMLVATEGSSAGSGSTAITLLSGVEPILQAAPNASQAMMLTPWSLGGAPGGEAGSQ